MAAREPTTNHQEIRDWAKRHNALPAERLPHVVDGVPAVLRFLLVGRSEERMDERVLPWEDFFAKFDALGLTFAYDEGVAGNNEILQIEEKSPYRSREYRPMDN